MFQLILVLSPVGEDAERGERLLRGLGLEPPHGAESARRESFHGLPTLDSLHRELLAACVADAAPPARPPSAALPPGLLSRIQEAAHAILERQGAAAPVVLCSTALDATLPFWIEALTPSGIVLVSRLSQGGTSGALAVATGAPPARNGAGADAPSYLHAVRAAAASLPCLHLDPDRVDSDPERETEGVAAWLRETLPGFAPLPTRMPPPAHLRPVATAVDPAEAAQAELANRDHRIHFLELEIDRLSAALAAKKREVTYRRGRQARLAERLGVERRWRRRIQKLPPVRLVMRLMGMRRLLRDPWRQHLRELQTVVVEEDTDALFETSLDKTAAGLELLRRTLGTAATAAPPSEEDLRLGPTPRQVGTWISQLAMLKRRPRISILMPVHRIEPGMLRAGLQSLHDQIYPEWELCVALDAAVGAEARAVLSAFAPRLGEKLRTVEVGGTPGIAVSTNRAAGLASGEFLGFLDHDDCLTCQALLQMALRIEASPEADLIYSDEDKITPGASLRHPFLKPDFSPELLLSFNYITHLTILRRSLFEEIGGVREGFEGSQDFDLVLRATEKARRVEHVADILYHWRMHPESTAKEAEAKGGVWREASKRALEDAVARRGWNATVENGLVFDTYRVRFRVDPAAAVTVIIPTRDHVAALRMCVRSLLHHTDHPAFEILVVSNDTRDPGALRYLEEGAAAGLFRVLRHDLPFNYSALNNFAAARCDTPFLVFLNDDTEALEGSWMTAMLEHAQRPEIGAVGAKLLYPSRTVQHAGVFIDAGGAPQHAFHRAAESAPGYFNLSQAVRNTSAVTAACMMVRKAVFDEVGGFDEELAVTFNDVDFCFRVRRAGYRVVFTPYARLLHFESLTRGDDKTPERQQRLLSELALLKSHWPDWIKTDPYYNPGLNRFPNDFSATSDRYPGLET